VVVKTTERVVGTIVGVAGIVVAGIVVAGTTTFVVARVGVFTVVGRSVGVGFAVTAALVIVAGGIAATAAGTLGR